MNTTACSERVRTLARRILVLLTPTFFGDVVISVKSGKITTVKVIRTETTDGELEVQELFRVIAN